MLFGENIRTQYIICYYGQIYYTIIVRYCIFFLVLRSKTGFPRSGCEAPKTILWESMTPNPYLKGQPNLGPILQPVEKVIGPRLERTGSRPLLAHASVPLCVCQNWRRSPANAGHLHPYLGYTVLQPAANILQQRAVLKKWNCDWPHTALTSGLHHGHVPCCG